MKNQKSKTTPNGVVKTQNAAASAFKVSARTISSWKAEGGEEAGFRPDGTVDLKILGEWVRRRLAARNGPMEAKEQKILEEIRKLKLANDAKERTLISRAWMAERIHIAAGKVDGFRQKSEAEHPLLFAAAAGDVPACREVVRKIWDEVIASMNSLSTDFKEPGDNTKEPRA